jgi:hypothetical protein
MLDYMNRIIQVLKYEGVGDRVVETIDKMQKCTNPGFLKSKDPPCTSIGYSIIGDKRKDR